MLAVVASLTRQQSCVVLMSLSKVVDVQKVAQPESSGRDVLLMKVLSVVVP